MTELRRMQIMATGLLVLSLCTLVLAKWLEPRYPGFAYVAAFAEAATIGGLADWYAVVALFRRPLGLPIPHTAILPANQARVADGLGDFIETNFLAEEPVRRKLQETDFSALLIEWLADGKRADALAGYAVRLLPQALNAADASRLKTFMAERMQDAVRRVDLSPWVANLLDGLHKGRRHQKLLDDLLDLLGRALLDPRSVDTILARIREELPTLLRTLGADGFLLRKIVGSAAALIEEVKADRKHPLRAEVDQMLRALVERLRTSPDLKRKVEDFKTSLLQRSETSDLFQTAWDSIRSYVEADAARPESVIRAHLAAMLQAAARQMTDEPALREEFNKGMVTVLAAFVERQKTGISRFISAQVKGWDMTHMTAIVENKIGRDLQYIRFNGTIIGGLIGLALYVIMHSAGLR